MKQNTNELLWNGDVVGEYTWYAPDKCRSTTLEIIHECKCRIPELERILDSSDMNLSFDFLYGSKLYQVYLLDIFLQQTTILNKAEHIPWVFNVIH